MKWIAIFLAGLFTASCMEDDSALRDEPMAAAVAKDPVFVLTGGFNTCGEGGNPSTQGIAQEGFKLMRRYAKMYPGEKVDFVITCFNGLSSNYIYYYSTANRNLRYTEWDKNAPLLAEMGSFGTRPVVQVGHSYGGWLAMQLALRHETVALATIDPISPYHCNQGGFLQGMISSFFGGGGTVGCTSFPPDISVAQVGALKTRRKWFHYFQDQYAPLHSNVVLNAGSPDGADITAGKNGRRIFFPGGGGSYGGVHSTINLSGEVWDQIGEMLRKDATNAIADIAANRAGGFNLSEPFSFEFLSPVLQPQAPDDDTTLAEQRFAETGVMTREFADVVRQKAQLQ
jgi:hypothetical protein